MSKILWLGLGLALLLTKNVYAFPTQVYVTWTPQVASAQLVNSYDRAIDCVGTLQGNRADGRIVWWNFRELQIQPGASRFMSVMSDGYSYFVGAYVQGDCRYSPTAEPTEPNDLVPEGPLVKSGRLTGRAGADARGLVSIYDQGNGRYVIRLSDLRVDERFTSLELRITDQGTATTDTVSLRASRGNQNYLVGLVDPLAWNVDVEIYDPVSGLVIARALF
jgi:hypothetical protein